MYRPRASKPLKVCPYQIRQYAPTRVSCLRFHYAATFVKSSRKRIKVTVTVHATFVEQVIAALAKTDVRLTALKALVILVGAVPTEFAQVLEIATDSLTKEPRGFEGRYVPGLQNLLEVVKQKVNVIRLEDVGGRFEKYRIDFVEPGPCCVF